MVNGASRPAVSGTPTRVITICRRAEHHTRCRSTVSFYLCTSSFLRPCRSRQAAEQRRLGILTAAAAGWGLGAGADGGWGLGDGADGGGDGAARVTDRLSSPLFPSRSASGAASPVQRPPGSRRQHRGAAAIGPSAICPSRRERSFHRGTPLAERRPCAEHLWRSGGRARNTSGAVVSVPTGATVTGAGPMRIMHECVVSFRQPPCF